MTLTDDEDDDSVRPRRTLRSGQRKLKLTLKSARRDEDEFGESDIESDEDDDDEYASSRYARAKKAKGKRRAVPKGAKPEYGTVKSIEDIDLDYFSDDEDKALRAHRKFCEKCHLTPANIQLVAWKRRKSRKKAAKSDEETDEEERIERLGGWVRWYAINLACATLVLTSDSLKCCVSAHWGCMAQTQRDEILRAIRQCEGTKWKADYGDENGMPPKRKELEVREMTDFICGQSGLESIHKH